MPLLTTLSTRDVPTRRKLDHSMQENLQRKQIKAQMREWQKKYPGRVENMFSADGVANPAGDIAFDEEPCSTPAENTISLQRL